ncbi:MAG: CRISPR system precrRNA processing endoribonuclease RAMP protein Cas6 [Blastocatellia bacterium]
MLSDRCIYPYLFETPPPPGLAFLRGQQRAPHPFILSPPSPFEPTVAKTTKSSPASECTRATVSPALSDPGSIVGLAAAGVSALPALHKTANAPPTLRNANGSRGRNGSPSRNPFGSHRLRLASGDEITFGLTLIGRAIEYLPYVVFAVSEMARRGLGFDRARFELAKVHLIDKREPKRLIYSGGSNRIDIQDASATSLADLVRARLEQIAGGSPASTRGWFDSKVELRFVTPTRIRIDGDLQAGMSFELLVRNLLRRVSLLCAVHGRARLDVDFRGLIDQARNVKTVASNLRWCDWERYSNRQQTKMTLGGFVGEIEYEGHATEELRALMVAGELLHIGTGTAFGLGGLEIV